MKHPASKRAAVLRAFSECGRVDLACKAAGVDRSMHYDWLKKHPDYAAAFERMREQALDMLEDEAWRRAREGFDEPVFHAGKQAQMFARDADGQPVKGPDGKFVAVPAVVRRYSDGVLTFLLKGRRKQVYGDRIEHTGAGGAAIEVRANVRDTVMRAVEDLPDESKDMVARKLLEIDKAG